MLVENKHNAPKKLWRDFKTEYARMVYNSVMDQSSNNQSITIHPDTPRMPEEQWETICHNFACLAAWTVAAQPLKPGDTVIDEDENGKKVARRKVK